MPNHCYQQVFIEGPHCLVSRLWDGLTENGYDPYNGGRCKGPQFCQLIVPMPIEQWQAPKTNWRGHEVSGWYDWRVNNWGTKWDVCEVTIEGEFLPTHPDEDQWSALRSTTSTSFDFSCWTAWGPPTPVWDKLHEIGVDVHATYQDEGGMFEGEYAYGTDRSWEPELREEA